MPAAPSCIGRPSNKERLSAAQIAVSGSGRSSAIAQVTASAVQPASAARRSGRGSTRRHYSPAPALQRALAIARTRFRSSPLHGMFAFGTVAATRPCAAAIAVYFSVRRYIVFLQRERALARVVHSRACASRQYAKEET